MSEGVRSITLPEKHSPVFSLGRSLRNFEPHAGDPAGVRLQELDPVPLLSKLRSFTMAQPVLGLLVPKRPLLQAPRSAKINQPHILPGKITFWEAGLQSLVELPRDHLGVKPTPSPSSCPCGSAKGQRGSQHAKWLQPFPWLLQYTHQLLQSPLAG